MTGDQPKKSIRGYVSQYLREPPRSLREAEEQQEAQRSDRESDKGPQQPKD
jgi:hypothetical protein